MICFFFFSSRRRHTRYWRDWSSDVCSSDLIFSEKYILGTAIDYSYSKANFQRYAGRSNSKSVGLSFYGKILLASDFYTQARVGINKISTRVERDRKSTRLNSSHANISYAVFCLKKKK